MKKILFIALCVGAATLHAKPTVSNYTGRDLYLTFANLTHPNMHPNMPKTGKSLFAGLWNSPERFDLI